MGGRFRFRQEPGRHSGVDGKESPGAGGRREEADHVPSDVEHRDRLHVISTAWSGWTFVVPGTNNQLEARYGGHYEDTVAGERALQIAAARGVQLPFSDPTAIK